MSLDWIRINAMTFAPMILRMLMDPQPLPGPRLSKERVAELLQQEQVEECLRLYGFDV